MEWHLSKYNLFTKPPNHNFIMVFNLLKNTKTTLTPEEFISLNDFKELDENSLIFDKFKKQGIIVNYDELAVLQAMAKRSYLNDKIVSLTICPTLNCNFNCSYCFQQHRKSKMSKEIEDEIVNFTIKMVDTIKPNTLYITWFGGEPLLEIEIIDSLSQKLIEIANNRSLNYISTIVTNGYLLTQKNVDILAKNKVRKYQITLDGIGDMHNITRHLKNGDPTFETITENLRTLKIPGKINIRNNIYNNNKKDIPLLKKLVKNLAAQSGNNIIYYPAIVVKNKVNCFENASDYLDDEEASKLMIMKDSKKLRPRKSHFCGAELLNHATIDPEGKLYKCWEDVDKPERSFGNIKEWDPRNPFFTANNVDILTHYLNLAGGINDKECLECIWLPVCSGGCPSKQIYSTKHCLAYRYNIDDYTAKLAENILKNKK